ncbi:MAG: hypothetical protein AB7O24_24020 [Kofleriaceae bacterium]
METCSVCGVQLAMKDVLYNEHARVLCPMCFAKADIAATDQRAAAYIKTTALSSLTAAGVAWLINPFFVFSLLAVSSAVYAIKSMLPGNERFSNLLSSGDRTLVWIGAIGGLALTGLWILVMYSGFKQLSA